VLFSFLNVFDLSILFSEKWTFLVPALLFLRPSASPSSIDSNSFGPFTAVL